MKHHYIPKFWLRRWADTSGAVLRYRKLPTGRVTSKRLSPDGIGYHTDLYRAPLPEMAEAQMLELAFFQKLDGQAALALDELCIQGRVPSHQSVETWWRFVLMLLHRSPTYFGATQAIAQKHYEGAVEAYRADLEHLRLTDPAAYERHKRTDDEVRETLIRRLYGDLPRVLLNREILKYFREMTWQIMDVPAFCHPLLLSDDPLVRSNGLKQREGHLAVPLTPRRLLVGAHDSGFAREMMMRRPQEIVRAANTTIVEGARHFVAASDEGQERFISNRFGALPRPPILKASDVGR